MKGSKMIFTVIACLMVSCSVVVADDVSYSRIHLERMSFEYPDCIEMTVTVDDNGSVTCGGQDDDCYIGVTQFTVEDAEEYDIESSVEQGFRQSFRAVHSDYEIVSDEDLSENEILIRRQIVTAVEWGEEVTDSLCYIFDGVNYITIRTQVLSEFESMLTSEKLDIMDHVIESVRVEDVGLT